ncbi:MAG: adenylate cyclase [Methylibium sp. NZG]|nr:MAG: adenylate cyclase [Methylibium sp. NZG]
MPRNIEIKARVADLPALQARVAALAQHGPELIEQDDTFFHCTHGRLKLRAFADGRGELIAYERPDATGPKTSSYLITPTADPDALRATLARSLGEVGRVRKQRVLFLVGRTRIHLDRVEGLGEFLELEVVLRDGEDDRAGVDEAHSLLKQLGVPACELQSGAYIDLLAAAGTAAASALR